MAARPTKAFGQPVTRDVVREMLERKIKRLYVATVIVNFTWFAVVVALLFWFGAFNEQ